MLENERSAGVACFASVRDQAGRVLLVRQNYGPELWALPGGMAQPGESLPDTARREVSEETSLSVELTDVIAVADRGGLIVIVFGATTTQTDARPQESEISECRWFLPSELLDLGDLAFAFALRVAQRGPADSGLKAVELRTEDGFDCSYIAP